MIKAAHNRLYIWFFGSLIRLFMRIQFRAIRVHGRVEAEGKSLLVIGNHFSWWDGFFALHISRKTFRRKLFVMMLEEQLKERPFLARMGAFSIKKNSRSAIESLNYAAELLTDPRNVLLLFPQGKFQSHHQHPLSFEKGWLRILQKAQGNYQVVFMAYLTDYFSHPRPELSIYLANFNPPENFDNQDFEDAYNAYLHHCIQQQNLKA